MTTIAERSPFPQVLVVEDNTGDVILLRLAFKRAGNGSKITVADTAETALAMLARQGDYCGSPLPDLILLDLNLPRMHGLEFLKRIKSDPKLARIPAIVLTSSCAESDIAASYLGHAVGFITKPIGLDDYEKVVNGIATYWFRTVQTLDANEAPVDRRPLVIPLAGPKISTVETNVAVS